MMSRGEAQSRSSALAVNPSAASSAAMTPLRAQWPICIGLVIVPKFAFTPDAMDAAIASAVAVCTGLRRSSTLLAAAAPKVPSVAVGCQPLS